MLKCRLRVILAEKEIKQNTFAQKVGISQATMSGLVNNRQLPTLEVAYRIAEELQLTVHDIWIKQEEDVQRGKGERPAQSGAE